MANGKKSPLTDVADAEVALAGAKVNTTLTVRNKQGETRAVITADDFDTTNKEVTAKLVIQAKPNEFALRQITEAEAVQIIDGLKHVFAIV